MTPISFTTHEFSTKVLRRGRSIQLREISTTPHVFMNNSLSTVIARLYRSRGNLRVRDEIATSDYRPPRNDRGGTTDVLLAMTGRIVALLRNDRITYRCIAMTAKRQL